MTHTPTRRNAASRRVGLRISRSVAQRPLAVRRPGLGPGSRFVGESNLSRRRARQPMDDGAGLLHFGRRRTRPMRTIMKRAKENFAETVRIAGLRIRAGRTGRGVLAECRRLGGACSPQRRAGDRRFARRRGGIRRRRSGKSRSGALARREAVVRAPRSPVAVARGSVEQARRARGACRELVRVVQRERRASGGRTAISRAVRGAPNRYCGIAAAACRRRAPRSGVAATRRGDPPGPWRDVVAVYATSAPRARNSSRNTERWQRASSAQ